MIYILKYPAPSTVHPIINSWCIVTNLLFINFTIHLLLNRIISFHFIRLFNSTRIWDHFKKIYSLDQWHVALTLTTATTHFDCSELLRYCYGKSHFVTHHYRVGADSLQHLGLFTSERLSSSFFYCICLNEHIT